MVLSSVSRQVWKNLGDYNNATKVRGDGSKLGPCKQLGMILLLQTSDIYRNGAQKPALTQTATRGRQRPGIAGYR